MSAPKATPAQIAAAWRVFRGERKGFLLGPGPGFAEAIEAALALDPLAGRVAALEAEVERLRLAADWDRPNLTIEDRKLINNTPALLSILYDVDLLPEQLMSQDEKTPGLGRAYHRFLGIMLGYRLGALTTVAQDGSGEKPPP